MERRLIRVLLVVISLNCAQVSASDLTWSETYEVPDGEIWIIRWVTPYSPGEIIPAYDLRIIEGRYQILDREFIYEHQDNFGLASLFAKSKSVEGQVTIYEGSRFRVANDILEFRLVKSVKRETDSEN